MAFNNAGEGCLVSSSLSYLISQIISEIQWSTLVMSHSLALLWNIERIVADLSCLYLTLKDYWLWFCLSILSSKTKPSRPLGAVLPASKGHCQFCMLMLCDCSLINLQLCRDSFAHTDIQETSFVLNMAMGFVRWKELLFWFEYLISSVSNSGACFIFK